MRFVSNPHFQKVAAAALFITIFAFFQNFSFVGTPSPSDISWLLPGSMDGAPSRFLVEGAQPNYATLQPIFRNTAGSTFNGSTLAFSSNFQSLIFGWQKSSNYFYVWDSAQASAQAYGSPVCEGFLQNDTGAALQDDQISHVVLFDGRGTGNAFLFVMHKYISWFYVYDLNFSSLQYGCQGRYQWRPVASGSLTNSAGAPITGNDLDFIFPVDYEGTGAESLQGFQLGASWSYQWGLNPSSRLEFQKDRPLPSGLSGVRGAFNNRIATGFSNFPGASEVYIADASGFLKMTKDTTTRFSNCSKNSALCRGKQFVISVDQGFANGPVQTYGSSAAGTQAVITLLQNIQKIKATGINIVALINPAHTNKQKLDTFLNLLRSYNIQFVFDMISSDTQSGSIHNWSLAPVSSPDISRSLSLKLTNDIKDMNSISYYTNKYGTYLQAFRIFEQQGLQMVQESCRNLVIPIQRPGETLAATVARMDSATLAKFNWMCWYFLKPGFENRLNTSYLDDSLKTSIRTLLTMAKNSNRRVYWSDNHGFNPYEYYHINEPRYANVRLADSNYKDFKKQMSTQYGSTVIPIYANNEGRKVNMVQNKITVTPRNFRLNTWQLDPKFYRPTGDFGVSIQSWQAEPDPMINHLSLPPEELAVWETDAFNKGASLIQIEPLWYFTSWPKGSYDEAFAPNSCTGSALKNLTHMLSPWGLSTVQLNSLSICP